MCISLFLVLSPNKCLILYDLFCIFMFNFSHRPIPNHHEAGSRERDRDRDLHPHLGAPPPLISPKPQPREHTPAPPTTLWNPASLIETSSESRRPLHEPHSGHYDISRLAPSAKTERHFSSEKPKEGHEKFPLIRPTGFSEPRPFLVELEKSTQSFLNQQRAALSLSTQYGELSGTLKSSVVHKGLQGPAMRPGSDAMLVYDEYLQLHRRPISKLDLEERKRREAREKGQFISISMRNLANVNKIC